MIDFHMRASGKAHALSRIWRKSMITILLYIAVVLIWGSTWLAVKFQIGVVPAEVSVAYRIGIAAAFMFLWALTGRLPLRFKAHEHLFMMLQGALIFSTNFFLFYLAAAYLTTGLIAVIFSTASAMTILLNAIVLRRKPALRVLLGGTLGVIGITIIFWPELAGFSFLSGAGFGLMLTFGGTLCFSLGSIVSARNRAAGLPVCGNTAWAMFYGVVILSFFAYSRGSRFNFDLALPYVASLAYLAIFGSVIAFAAYFALLGRIAAERAAYATVLFPVVALTLSTFFENYHWTAGTVAGVFIILTGNILVLRKPQSTADGKSPILRGR
jgi:drug/metabolite transporter (DMT)-like permease